jgi:protein-L-isoaspartate(D-aspartate) O-methyltransferase
MTTTSDSPPSADQLRSQLTTRLRDSDLFRLPGIEAAFSQVPRHLFLPGVPLQQAYADEPVYVKHDDSGVNISAASQPHLVAKMLGQLSLAPGHRVLEIGAGTGYNAALMAAITGPAGHVTTIDVDQDLVQGARTHLRDAGLTNADVLCGDGALGHPADAPFDRIIATVGAFEVPDAWLDQLASGGRLVVPLRLRGACSRSIIFERGPDGWISLGSELAVFMPLRGIGDDARRVVPLTPGGDVSLQVHKDQHAETQVLAAVLDTTAWEEWTGVMFPPEVSFEWLDLWLSLRLDNPLMRMNAQPAAKERGQVRPMFGWGSMATVRGSSLAYLTLRLAPPGPDGDKLYEVGVVGHGPAGAELAGQAAQEISMWDQRYRTRSVDFAMCDQPGIADPAHGRFLLNRDRRPIAITWR